MKTLLAFGDSNTWGLIPGSVPGQRYPLNVRWTGLLTSALPDVNVIEEGLCGRTTVFEDAFRPGRKGLDSLPGILESHQPIDTVLLMLGTNDCKSIYGASSHTIGMGIERCLDRIEEYVPADRIILISPLYLGENVWRDDKDPEFNKRSIVISKELRDVYSKIAKRRGHKFLAASDHAVADPLDDEHLNEIGHRIFFKAVLEFLRDEELV